MWYNSAIKINLEMQQPLWKIQSLKKSKKLVSKMN